MNENMNTKVILSQRPESTATADCFEVIEEPLKPLRGGQIRVEVAFVSVDAGTRTMLVGEGFHQQVALGDTILAGGVGRIKESKAEGFEVGQVVRGGLGVQTAGRGSPKMAELG